VITRSVLLMLCPTLALRALVDVERMWDVPAGTAVGRTCVDACFVTEPLFPPPDDDDPPPDDDDPPPDDDDPPPDDDDPPPDDDDDPPPDDDDPPPDDDDPPPDDDDDPPPDDDDDPPPDDDDDPPPDDDDPPPDDDPTTTIAVTGVPEDWSAFEFPPADGVGEKPLVPLATLVAGPGLPGLAPGTAVGAPGPELPGAAVGAAPPPDWVIGVAVDVGGGGGGAGPL